MKSSPSMRVAEKNILLIVGDIRLSCVSCPVLIMKLISLINFSDKITRILLHLIVIHSKDAISTLPQAKVSLGGFFKCVIQCLIY